MIAKWMAKNLTRSQIVQVFGWTCAIIGFIVGFLVGFVLR